MTLTSICCGADGREGPGCDVVYEVLLPGGTFLPLWLVVVALEAR